MDDSDVGTYWRALGHDPERAAEEALDERSRAFRPTFLVSTLLGAWRSFSLEDWERVALAFSQSERT
jgi:hypothetical protein